MGATEARNRFARATPVYALFQAPLKKFEAAALVGVQVWLCRSIHWPLSIQSGPRIGTTISSVVTSFAS